MKIVKTGRCSLAVTICVAAALAASEADAKVVSALPFADNMVL